MKHRQATAIGMWGKGFDAAAAAGRSDGGVAPPVRAAGGGPRPATRARCGGVLRLIAAVWAARSAGPCVAGGERARTGLASGRARSGGFGAPVRSGGDGAHRPLTAEAAWHRCGGLRLVATLVAGMTLAALVAAAPMARAAGAAAGPWGLGAPIGSAPGATAPDTTGLPADATSMPVDAVNLPAPGGASATGVVRPWASPVFGAPLSPGAAVAGAFSGFAGGSDRQRAIDCMTVAIAYEAGNQPLAGQQAVGQVILNRVRDPRFPKSVCGVVFAGAARATGCQFTFTCDGSLGRRLADATMLTARIAAEGVMDGTAPDRVSGATHYHADYVLPAWALSGTAVARIGAHIFYRLPGGGAPRLGVAAFSPIPPAAVGEIVPVAEPAYPALARVTTRHRPPRGAAARLALAGGAGAGAAGHALFAPWGLPVAAGR